MGDNKERKYKKIKSREHVLKRPDMYIGSIVEYKSSEWIYKDDKIIKEKISINKGLDRIFVEILSNAIDNYFESLKYGYNQTFIKVLINEEGKTIIKNNGMPIKVKYIDELKIHLPEFIFGTLRCGSNFEDGEGRNISGKNGLGCKLTNIFSKLFIIECCDGKNMIKVTFTDNMKNKEAKLSKSNKCFTKITYLPDFEYFKCKGYNEDLINLFIKRCYDSSVVIGKECKIYYNNKLLDTKEPLDYCKKYIDIDDYLEIKLKEFFILLSPSNNKKGNIISFVNGNFTRDGGVHVKEVKEKLLKPLLKKFKDLNIKNILSYFFIFINCKVEEPFFDGQTKEKLTGPIPNINIKPKYIREIFKWDVINSIKKDFDLKELVKNENKKTLKKVFIDNADDANFAGSKRSKDCSLFITEGLSAKTFAVYGISTIKGGEDYYGIYPIRGKFINVQKCNIKKLSTNRELLDIKTLLGLKFNTDYMIDKNFETLRYGSVTILTDADVDGIHIRGLLLNFFKVLFPSLIKKKFVEFMLTPAVKIKVIGKNKVLKFFDIFEYKKWKEQGIKHKYDYYKGLGTNTKKDIEECFDLKKYITFIEDKSQDESIKLAFNKDYTDERKKWLLNIKNENMIENRCIENFITISDFVNYELIKYSYDDLHRTIPSIMDGLKISQRKVLYSCFKRNLTKKVKVQDFAGYVAENTSYVHGQDSLYETIIKMAQDFIGSNNIPLLKGIGQFGSRIQGGYDAAKPRYIYTCLNKITRFIFISEDDDILTYQNEDNMIIEPSFYVPIVPMILVNGASGIGTGFSCTVPNYNLKKCIKWIKEWLKEKEELDYNYPFLKPYYEGFRGEIEILDNKIITKGIIKDNVITELPIGVWTDNYKIKLNNFVKKGLLESYKSYPSTEEVKIVLKGDINTNKLGLTKNISLTNLVLFDINNYPKRYINVYEIINEFCEHRYKYYELRKKNILIKLDKDLTLISNKYRFIMMIIDKKLVIEKRKKEDIIKDLEFHEFTKVNKNFKYLLSLPVSSFTKEKLGKLEKELEKIKDKIENIKIINISDMWIKELDELLSLL